MIETRKTELAAADVTKSETLWMRELQRKLIAEAQGFSKLEKNSLTFSLRGKYGGVGAD